LSLEQAHLYDPTPDERAVLRRRSVTAVASSPALTEPFRHEAMLYAGEDDFCAQTLPFIREAVANEEPILVVVGAPRLAELAGHLGDEARHVHFADMAQVGRNPARIIPAWHDFVADQPAGRPMRGIGEPIWSGRSPAELIECQYHESLLNLAFGAVPRFWLMCPYDTTTLDPEVIEAAHSNHRHVVDDGGPRESSQFRIFDERSVVFDAPLPEPAGPCQCLEFELSSLRAVRVLITDSARHAGLDEARAADFTLAVNEVATNSVRHGGGEGRLRMWTEAGTLICDVEDGGQLDWPLIGRMRPATDQIGGRGLWIANQICDLVQIRSFPSGMVTRLHLRLH